MFKISNPRSSVVLELQADRTTRRVPFPPGEGRGVVIGSTPLADFCVSGVRVAPVEFHLERAEEGVWLIPAYGIRDLRLNAAHVSGPMALEARNVIEFGGIRLAAIISETDDAALAPRADEQPQLAAAYARERSADQETPARAMPRVVIADAPALPDDPTRRNCT